MPVNDLIFVIINVQVTIFHVLWIKLSIIIVIIINPCRSRCLQAHNPVSKGGGEKIKYDGPSLSMLNCGSCFERLFLKGFTLSKVCGVRPVLEHKPTYGAYKKLESRCTRMESFSPIFYHTCCLAGIGMALRPRSRSSPCERSGRWTAPHPAQVRENSAGEMVPFIPTHLKTKYYFPAVADFTPHNKCFWVTQNTEGQNLDPLSSGILYCPLLLAVFVAAISFGFEFVIRC